MWFSLEIPNSKSIVPVKNEITAQEYYFSHCEHVSEAEHASLVGCVGGGGGGGGQQAFCLVANGGGDNRNSI